MKATFKYSQTQRVSAAGRQMNSFLHSKHSLFSESKSTLFKLSDLSLLAFCPKLMLVEKKIKIRSCTRTRAATTNLHLDKSVDRLLD